MKIRRYLPGLMALLVLLSPTAVLASQTSFWHFNVSLDGKPIGQHSFELTRKNYRQMLSSEADFLVKFLFVNAYYYEHTSTEYWDGNCLQQIESRTIDNGKSYEVSGQLGERGFMISGENESLLLPECIMTFAYWNPKILEQDKLLNSQTGEYVDVSITFVGRENLSGNSGTVPANRYFLEAGRLRISLWYDIDSRQWLALESLTEDDHVLRYELIDYSNSPALSKVSYD